MSADDQLDQILGVLRAGRLFGPPKEMAAVLVSQGLATEQEARDALDLLALESPRDYVQSYIDGIRGTGTESGTA